MKRFLAPLLALAVIGLFTPAPAMAAGITFDASSSLNSAAWTVGSTPTWTHTTGAGATLLVCGVYTANTTDQLTSVKYNGVSMTQITKSSSSAVQRTTYLYYLTNPASGAHSVALTFSASQSNIAAACASYLGTGTTASVIDTSNNPFQNTTSTSFQPTTSASASTDWYVGMARAGGGTALALSSGSLRGGLQSGTVELYDSNGAVSAGTVGATVTTNDGPGDAWDSVIATIKIPSATTFSFWQFFPF